MIELNDEQAEQVREALRLHSMNCGVRIGADACTCGRDRVLALLSVPAAGGGQPSERDAALEAVAVVAREFVATTSVFRQALCSRREFEALAIRLLELDRLAAVSKDTPEAGA